MDNISIKKSRLMSDRTLLGRICLLAFIITLIGVFDTLVSAYRKPVNQLDMMTGSSLDITGTVYGNVKNPSEIGVATDSPNLVLHFDEALFSGYWLGIKMWRGELLAGSMLTPGRYNMKILFHDLSDIKPNKRAKVQALSTYTVNVYEDAKAMRQHDLSLIKRFTGLSPWSIAIAFFLIVLMTGGLIFAISGKIDLEMAQHGFAEIYRVNRHDKGLEVFFGFGKIHGLKPGEKMNLLHPSGDLIAEIAVENIGNENSSAVVNTVGIRPGFLVARNNAYPI